MRGCLTARSFVSLSLCDKYFFNAEGAEAQSGRESKDRAGIRKALLYSVLFERSFFLFTHLVKSKTKEKPQIYCTKR